MEILSFDTIDSTHLYLIDAVREGKLDAPIAVIAENQSAGVGSRGDRWIGERGNLFLSFALDREELPKDLPLSSLSIYFAYLMKLVLKERGSEVWLKWPNDFYIKDKKAGGLITSLINNRIVIVSMGLNLKNAPDNFTIIDINIEKDELLEKFFLKVDSNILWKNIFRDYKIEFEKSRAYFFRDKEDTKVYSLRDAKLEDDGSIIIENRRIYSLR